MVAVLPGLLGQVPFSGRGAKSRLQFLGNLREKKQTEILIRQAQGSRSCFKPSFPCVNFPLPHFVNGDHFAVLTGQGLDPSQAVLVSFSMHFFTQVVDYSLGGGALIHILWRMTVKEPKKRLL